MPGIIAILYDVLLWLLATTLTLHNIFICLDDTSHTYSKEARGSLLQIITQDDQIYVQQLHID